MWASLKSFKLPASLRNSNEAWTSTAGGESNGIEDDGAENNKQHSSVVSSSPMPPARRRTSSQLKSQTPLVSGSDHAVLVLDAQEASYEDWNRLLGSFQPTILSEEDDKERGSVLKQEMATLIWKGGIPDHLRGKAWNILARAEQSKELLELYPVLLKKETSSEVMDSISIDIMRTFPAHALFKDASGLGQDILLKISKAYSNYDEEVGYFQGLSFLAAALVLHLPEEEAFCLLVKMTYEYGLRGLYRNGMEVLKTRFYQFERYIEELMPDLHAHLTSQEIEMQMFASQWFLTVFCAKFSLSFAFRVLDLFFLEGMDAVLKVALCILRDNRKELLQLGFEDILHYLRIQIPKKYSEVQSIDEVFAAIAEMKLSHAKLLQFESEHKSKLAADAAADAEAKAELSSVASSASSGETNQLEVLTARLAIADRQKKRLERENKRVSEQNARLEEETNSLARQLVERQVSLMQALERAGEEKSALRKELLAVKESSSREKSRLQQELDQLRTLYRSALAEALEERSRLEQEKCELKALCRQLGQQHEQDKSSLQSENDELRSLIAILSANHSGLRPPDSASQKLEETPPLPLACKSVMGESGSSTPTNNNSNTDSDDNKPNHVNGMTTSFTPELLFRIRELADAGRRGDEQRKESDLANESRLRALEEQLALTKLQLAECECQRQELDLALKQAKGVDSSGKRHSQPHTSRPIGISSAGGGASSLSFSPGSGSPTNALGKGWLLLKRNDPT